MALPTPRQRTAARLTWIMLGAALAAPVLVFVGALGVRFGWWDAAAGYDLLTWRIGWPLSWIGAGAGAAAVVFAARDPRRLMLLGLVALAVGGATAGLFLLQRQKLARPSAPDVASDLADPPGFSDLIASARARDDAIGLGRPTACRAARTAPTQAAPEQAAAALEAAGFQVLGSAPFRAEGSREGFWFGFTHDAVVRIRPGATDVRVAARDGRPDGGEACRLAGEISAALQAGA